MVVDKRVGIVVSKYGSTIKVVVERKFAHPIYKKQMKKHTNYLADDPKEAARVGDQVSIVHTKPISKLKHWSLSAIIQEELKK